MIQNIIAYAVIAAAVFFAVRFWVRRFRGRGGCGCGCDGKSGPDGCEKGGGCASCAGCPHQGICGK